MKRKLWNVINDYTVIAFGVLLSAIAIYFFLMPSQLLIGSISGLAIVLTKFIPLSVSLITMILNMGLLVIGFFFVGKEFGRKTAYTSALLPAFLWVFERLIPQNSSTTGDPFLDMLCYIFLASIGLTILFNKNASSGGLDVVIKILNKYLHVEMGKAMTIAGMGIAMCSVFVYDSKSTVISILGTYLHGLVLDHFIFGLNPKRRVCIISQKDNDIRTFIVNKLHGGATLYEPVGAYNLMPQHEIITIVNKHEYCKLMTYLTQVDPNAFVTVYNVSEVRCRDRCCG